MKTMLLSAVTIGAVLAGMLLYQRRHTSNKPGDSSHRSTYPGVGSGQQKKPLMS